MRERKIPEERLAVRGECDEDLLPVRCPSTALDKPLAHRPANQLDRAVMLQLQPLGEIANRRACSLRKAFQGKHQLMLLGFQSRSVGSLLAEMDEAPDLKAELRQRSILVHGNLGL